jgi:hypothetical protein
MREYSVGAHNTYTMDEKGFFVGVSKPGKRIFTKASLKVLNDLKITRVTIAIEDSPVTMVACDKDSSVHRFKSQHAGHLLLYFFAIGRYALPLALLG